jgi:hypothetical protein
MAGMGDGEFSDTGITELIWLTDHDVDYRNASILSQSTALVKGWMGLWNLRLRVICSRKVRMFL